MLPAFPALFSHLEYLAPRSSTLILSTETPSPTLEGGGVSPFLATVPVMVPSLHPCSQEWSAEWIRSLP